MDNTSLTKKILFDYFDGKSSSIQRKMIEEWLEDTQNKELYFQCLDQWEQEHPQYIFDIETGFLKVYKNIDKDPVSQTSYPNARINKFRFLRVTPWLAAAVIVLVSAWLSWQQIAKPRPMTYEKLVKTTKKYTGEIYEKVNMTTKPILVNLPDRSSVILQPDSKICFSPKQYNKDRREVILLGEAFFEVQKNPGKPFFVYANGLVTKVLGTSFFIKSQRENADMEVVVKTGKVAVFLQNDANKAKLLTDNFLSGLVLKANEKVTINTSDFTISKPVIITQQQLKLSIQRLSFNFDDAPAIEVISELEKAYGVDIVFDESKLTNCKLTAHLSDEPLMEKIDLICSALEATYREEDNKIILSSKGCQ